MTIKNISAKIFALYSKNNLELTPDIYCLEFCKELKKEGLSHPDCDKLSKSFNKLGADYQKILKQYPIRTIDDLNQFLISQVNRLSPSEAEAYILLLLKLCEAICNAVCELKNKDAAKLAQITKDKLQNTKNTDIIVALKKEWQNIKFDEDIFKPLYCYVKPRTNDCEAAIEDIKKAFDIHADNSEVIAVLVSALKPSFTKTIDEEIANLSKQIISDNSKIKSAQIIKELQSIIDKRIVLDNAEVRHRLQDIDDTLEIIASALNKVEQAGLGSSKNIGTLHKMIEHTNADGFETIKHKMLDLASILNNDIVAMTDLVQAETSQLELMQKRIMELEIELDSAKKEASIDFLTKLLNRKAIEDELVHLEQAHVVKHAPYSVIMFDIDYFKKINDSFGHLAGDAILSAFAASLRKHIKKEAYIGRWGGEEFVIALPNIKLSDAVELAEHIRIAIMHTKFIYKDTLIHVTASAGIASRNERANLHAVLKLADGRLYEAKHNGRNSIVPAK